MLFKLNQFNKKKKKLTFKNSPKYNEKKLMHLALYSTTAIRCVDTFYFLKSIVISRFIASQI